MRWTASADVRSRRRRATAGFLVLLALGIGGHADAARTTAAAPARIERVRYEADGTSTRVIVMLSRSVPYEVRILPGEPTRHSERRVVLDFSNARLAPGASEPIGVENGLLQQIRTGQFTERTARVVLDLASVTKHSVTAYQDPPRVVIDIAGEPVGEGTRTARNEPTSPPSREQPAAAPEREPAPPPNQETAAAPSHEAEPELPATAKAEPAHVEPAPPVAPEPKRTAAPTKAVELVPPPRIEAPPPTPAATAKAPEPPSQVASAPKSGAVPEPVPGRQPARPWRIVLDPGHGGSDPGALGVDGLVEKDVALAIAKQLKHRLEEGANAKVLLTRDSDVTRTLAERTAFANANSADLFISIHANADRSGDLQGIETYTLNNSNDRATIRLAKMENGPGVRVGHGDLSFILSDMVQSGKEEESNALAERVQSRVLGRLRARYTDIHNLGVKKGPFYVLVGAYMPCVLVETSFITHPVEGKRLGTTAYQNEIAEGLYLGITDFLGDARLAKTL